MPRDLADVLHYFMPDAAPKKGSEELPESAEVSRSPESAPATLRTRSPEPLQTRSLPGPNLPVPIAAIPIGDQDILSASFSWNLAVEIASLGATATLLTPADGDPKHLFPSWELGSSNAELRVVGCESPAELLACAVELSLEKAPLADRGGLILVRIPPLWLRNIGEATDLLRWLMLFASPDHRDLSAAYEIAKTVLQTFPNANLGVTIHGAVGLREAHEAFGRLASSIDRHLGHSITSYGLLVDDLDIYRAIVAQRAIGLSHPESPTATALRDVAKMVLEDVRVANVLN